MVSIVVSAPPTSDGPVTTPGLAMVYCLWDIDADVIAGIFGLLPCADALDFHWELLSELLNLLDPD